MNYDAILILGGGVRVGGELPEYAKRRFDLALARQTGEPLVPLSARTFHRPALLEPDGSVLNEAIAGARYLIDRGINPGRIFCENTALDTIGTAYFGRVQITDPLGWRHLLVITSHFHLPRTEAIFRWIYSLDASVPYRLEFASSSDDGLSEVALSTRIERERASLGSVERLRETLTSMRGVAEWLFTEHKAYMAVREPLVELRNGLLDSY